MISHPSQRASTQTVRKPGQEEAALLKAVVETVVDGILTIEEDGSILTANPAVERIFGYSPSELIGENVRILMPSPYHEEHDGYLRNYRETGHRRIIGIGREVRGRRKDGTEFPLELAVSETTTDRGRIFTGIVRDISERKRAEDQLRQSEDRLREMLENVELIAIVLDKQAKITFCNDYLLRLSGWSRKQVLGKNWFKRFIPVSDKANDREIFDSIHAGSIPAHLENSIQTKAGERRDILWSNTMLRDEAGSVVGVASIGEDITERNRATAELKVALEETERRVLERTAALEKTNQELDLAKKEADRANAAKSDFLSRMSHELRTPMNSILGYAQLLEMDDAGERKAHYVERILKGGRHLLGLINEVLELSRIEAGQLELSLEPVLVREVVWETIVMLEPMAKSLGVSLINHTGESDLHVRADLRRLQQVVLNLISNAIKYNEPNGAVSISLFREAEHACIEFEDTGVGIPSEMECRLFAPFERLGAAMGPIEGTGLGLAVCRRLCEAMGGEVAYRANANGKGSTFSIWLPVATAVEDTQKPSAASARLPSALCSGARTVLYVEDNLSNVELIQELLGKFEDVKLLVAMQGRMGIDLAKEHRPDLILLDIHLPDLDGAAVLTELKRTAALRETPVIVLSADATQRQIDRLARLGAHSFITKPFNVHSLLSRISEVLNAQEVPSRP